MPRRGGALLRLLARLVPRSLRAEWMAEWLGELADAEARGAGAGYRTARLADAAEDAARIRLGEVRSGGLRGLLQDVRYGWRALRRRPGYVLAAVITLALGIGANTAIFSVVSGVLLHPLPYEEPDRLVMLWSDGSRRGLGLRAGVPPADFLEWRETTSSFVGLAALRNSSLGFTQLEEPVVPLTHMITPGFFDLLGIPAARGRTFVEGDREGDHLVILSDRIWRVALGADPDAVGSTVVLDDEPWTVVGVLPPEVYITHQLPVQPDLWVPLTFDGLEDNRTARAHAVFARLRPGTTPRQAQEEMNAIAARDEARFPDSHEGWGVHVITVRDNVVGGYEETLSYMLAAVALVLLVACANVANLGLAQALERSREVALRVAMGAGRVRILRQLVAESVTVAVLGGLAGLGFAAVMLPALVRLIPGAGSGGSSSVGGAAAVPFLEHVGFDLRVLVYTLGVSLVIGVVIGLAPARRGGAADLRSVLGEGGRSGSDGRRSSRLRALLVVVETAVAVVLLVGAGLMLQSFDNLRAAEIGYDSSKLLTLRNSLREPLPPAGRVAYFEEAARALSALPGVESATGASFVPPEFANSTVRFHLPGQVPGPEHPSAVVRTVLPDYFRTLGIDIEEGRPIDARDGAEDAPAMVVNREFARRTFGDRPAVGARVVADTDGVGLLLRGLEGIEFEVVGVANNVRSAGTDPTPHAIVYLPAHQLPMAIMNLIVRTTGDPAALLRPAERTLWGLGRLMNVYNVETLDTRLGNLIWQWRFSMQLLAIFAVVALVLGAAGIYAVLSYAVSRRTHEVGVRLALGASRGAVLTLVMTQGLRTVLTGLALGLGASVALSSLLAGYLYGVAARDPWTMVGVVAVLLAVAVAACLSPALRATRVDPIHALRAQ